MMRCMKEDKSQEIQKVKENPLGVLPVGKLLMKFTVPSIVAMLTGALYNIVDQFFIGNRVGELGNAATNVAFPLSIACIATALLFGIGGAAAFNLAKGAGEDKKAVFYMGNALTGMTLVGVLLFLVTQLFLDPILRFSSTPDSVMQYAREYVRITSFGFPMLILSAGGGHLIRADGSPRFSMMCNIVGAVVNTVLDAIFVFGFDLGMSGAALATVIGQYISGFLAIRYLMHCKTVTLKLEHLQLHPGYVGRIASLGAAPCANQLAMMAVQLTMNRSLTYYGARSVYGEEIPLACAGIISKVNQLFFSFIIGLSQGLQPIISFNYGARKYERVRRAYLLSAGIGFCLSVIAFAVFQIFPRQLISIFGDGSKQYISFATSYFRTFLFFTFLNFLQPMTSNCFTAIGKPLKGMFLSLTRQIIFLLPLIVLLPLAFGIDGILYAGPIADGTAAFVAFVMIAAELRKPQYSTKITK